MDITVYSGNELLLYVENKTESASARRLIQKMREYGKIGFELNDSDVGNDELKKAKYLVRQGAFPKYFAVSAIDFEQIFLVEYICPILRSHFTTSTFYPKNNYRHSA